MIIMIIITDWRFVTYVGKLKAFNCTKEMFGIPKFPNPAHVNIKYHYKSSLYI